MQLKSTLSKKKNKQINITPIRKNKSSGKKGKIKEKNKKTTKELLKYALKLELKIADRIKKHLVENIKKNKKSKTQKKEISFLDYKTKIAIRNTKLFLITNSNLLENLDKNQISQLVEGMHMFFLQHKVNAFDLCFYFLFNKSIIKEDIKYLKQFVNNKDSDRFVISNEKNIPLIVYSAFLSQYAYGVERKLIYLISMMETKFNGYSKYKGNHMSVIPSLYKNEFKDKYRRGQFIEFLEKTRRPMNYLFLDDLFLKLKDQSLGSIYSVRKYEPFKSLFTALDNNQIEVVLDTYYYLVTRSLTLPESASTPLHSSVSFDKYYDDVKLVDNNVFYSTIAGSRMLIFKILDNVKNLNLSNLFNNRKAIIKVLKAYNGNSSYNRVYINGKVTNMSVKKSYALIIEKMYFDGKDITRIISKNKKDLETFEFFKKHLPKT